MRRRHTDPVFLAVEPVVEGLLPLGQLRVPQHLGVGAKPGGDAVARCGTCDHQGAPGGERGEPADLPLAHYVRHPACVGPATALSKGELPDEVAGDDVRPVVFGDGLRLAQVVRVDDRGAPRAEALRDGVLLPAQRVGNPEAEDRRGALDARGEPLVPRVAPRVAETGHARVVRVRLQQLRGPRGGLREQAVALLEYTARSVAGEGPPRVAVIYPGRKDVVGIVDAVEEHCRAKGWEHVSRLDYAAGGFDADAIVERLKTQGAAVVVSLGGEAENVMLLKSAQAKGWNPRVLLPGVLMGKGISEIPKVFKERLFLAYPTLPEDRKEWAVAEFSGLMKKHNLQTSHVAAQISAYSSAKILVEGLKRAGREVNRERFLSALESLFEFKTGLTPRITYNRNRRIGALGAYVVTVDPESADVRKGIINKGWVSLD